MKITKIELTDSEVYAAAADVIETHGLAKYLVVLPTGEMCVLGAINYVVAGSAKRYNKRGLFLLKQFADVLEIGDARVWNDAHERTKVMVVTALRYVSRKVIHT